MTGFVRTAPEPTLPPPTASIGLVATLRDRLFSGPVASVFTLLGIVFLAWAIPPLVRFLVVDPEMQVRLRVAG